MTKDEVLWRIKRPSNHLFLVKREFLPENLLKTAAITEMMKRHEALYLKDALELFDLSSTLYYKYRNGIFPFHDAAKDKIVTLLIVFEHTAGMLSKILNVITKHWGNIISINQSFPIHGRAHVHISVDFSIIDTVFDKLLRELKNLKGVHTIEILGRIDNTSTTTTLNEVFDDEFDENNGSDESFDKFFDDPH